MLKKLIDFLDRANQLIIFVGMLSGSIAIMSSFLSLVLILFSKLKESFLDNMTMIINSFMDILFISTVSLLVSLPLYFILVFFQSRREP